MLISEERTKEIQAIDEVLTHLQETDGGKEEIGNCRFFGGFTDVEPLSFSPASTMRVGWRSREISKELKPMNHPQQVPADGAIAI
jgi:hypothetical protein